MDDRDLADPVLDVSPSTQAATAIPFAGAELASNVPGDCYGSTTIAFGTVLTRVCPPRTGRFTRVKRVLYECGGTAHTLTCLVVQREAIVATDAAAGQAVIKFSAIPTLLDGSILAANDFFIVQDELGIFGAYHVASLSGLNVTVTTSVGDAGASGFVNKVLAETPIYIMGAPGDHPKRQFRMKASADTELFDCATSPNVNQPILIHSDNATATGYIKQVAYENPLL